MKTYQRDIENTFLEYSNSFKTVLVTGARQVGKTTMLKYLKDNERKYVTLDDFEIRNMALNNPKEFIEKYNPPVIIDEIQYAPNIMSYIKIKRDESTKKGLYWLIGSQKIELMKNVSESLAGRMGVLEMQSFSYREKKELNYAPLNLNDLSLKKILTRDEVINNILDGGMPGYLFDNIDREIFFESYINLYLERDIRSLRQIEDLTAFRIFLVSIASRSGQILNYSSIAKEIKKDDKTVKSWVSVLEATGIIKLIYPMRKKEIKRLTSNPKIIFMDLGLCTYLLRRNTIESLKKYTNLGFIFASYVISEIIKMNENQKLKFNIMFYRDKYGKEIDLLIEDYDGILHPYEIKMNSNVDRSMITSFNVLTGNYEVGKGGIICLANHFTTLGIKNEIIPISAILC